MSPRPRFKTAVALGLFAMAGLGLFLLFRGNQPNQGRMTGQWIDQCLRHAANPNSPEYLTAKRSLLAMGTNAVPHLILTEMAAETSVLWRTLLRVERHWPSFLRKPYGAWDTQARLRQGLADELLREIRPPGSMLLDLARARQGRLSTDYIVWLAQYCGEGKQILLPFLVNGMSSTNQVVLSWSLTTLLTFGTDTPEAVRCVIEADFYGKPIFERWLRIVGSFGTNAAAAVPKLKEFFDEERHMLRKLQIAKTLCLIDPDPGEMVTFLIECLPYPEVPDSVPWRYSTVECFANLDARASAAGPALLAQLELTEAAWSRMQILRFLKAIQMDPETVVAALRANNRIRTPGELLEYCDEILTIDPGNDEALQVLSGFISRKRGSWQVLSVFGILQQQGTNATAALPAIENLLADPGIEPSVRSLAESTRSAIRGTSP